MQSALDDHAFFDPSAEQRHTCWLILFCLAGPEGHPVVTRGLDVLTDQLAFACVTSFWGST